MVKMWGLLFIFVLVSSAVEGILTKPGDSKIASKTSVVETTKKSDQLEAQESHTHSVYGGYGDNNLGGGFGGGGLGSFGGGGGDLGGLGGYHGYGDHGHHHDFHHEHHHKHHDDGGYHKALAIKGLLIPLAGVALLGAAAAFVSNPILLQLGVISAAPLAGRRRRDTDHNNDLDDSVARLEAQARLNQIQTLERFMSQVPKEEIFSQEKKLMASYLSCSGITERNACLERLACELHSPGAESMQEETHVMSIITNEIFNNDLVPSKIKESMAEAVRLGRENKSCLVYKCDDLENLIRRKEK